MPRYRETLQVDRTREQFEQSMEDADCELFEAIARWVLQDPGYLNRGFLVKRIKQLEALEREKGILPITDLRKSYESAS